MAEQCDLLGFPLPVDLDVAAQRQRSVCDALAATRAAKKVWTAFAATGKLPADAALCKRAFRKGVPHHLRPKAWALAAGAAELRSREEAAGRSFAALLEEHESGNEVSVHQVDLDVHRTFPEHPWFRETDTGRASLRRVLVALSASLKDGYCQSMNYLSAWLLLVHRGHGGDEEQDAFWTLRAMLEQRCAPDTFAADLRGLHIELGTLQQLCELKLPRLASKLTELECAPTLYATDWVLCCFTGVLPTDTALRVWDAFLFEGVKVIHRCALALMRRAQYAVFSSDNLLSAVDALRHEAKHAHDRDALLEVAFNSIGSLSGAAVQRCRVLAKAEVDKQRAEMEERRRKLVERRQTNGV